jgi:hypothetical protein
MSFRVIALCAAQFQPLFALDDAALAERGARRVVATNKPGYPCRVSLRDAEPGERVLLINYEHQPAASPYRARHAIFVIEGAVEAHPAIDEVPAVLCARLLSIRAFDAAGMMVDAEVADGGEAAPVFERMLANPAVSYLHVHNARPGCYAARVER